MNTILVKILIIFTVLQTNTAFSNEISNKAFQHHLLVEGMGSDYRNTALEERYETSNKSVFISGDNDTQGYTVGYSTTNTQQEAGTYKSKQQKLFLSARFHEQPNSIDTTFKQRFDMYYVDSKDSLGNSNTLKIVSPQLTWTNKALTTQVNLGYSYSDYSSGQKVHQLTPTWGKAISDKDWLQLRSYLIRVSPSTSEDNERKKALEIKLTHTFNKTNPLNKIGKISYLQLSTVLGEREFAVDPDTSTVYNSGGEQIKTIALNTKWILTPVHSIGLSLGSADYKAFEQIYTSRYLALNWMYKPLKKTQKRHVR
ncbi:MAG TPA: hypothetical protein ENJ33_02290 [Thiothrix sp.]|nr:hypothetical protein [Thiothrix sp.]